MSVPAKFWALAQDTKGSERQVLNCLADWMIGNDAVVCWPSVETIAFETGCNRQTVMKATASLKQAGLITKKRRLVNDEWRMHYTLVGYVPSEWVNTERPTFESTKNRKYEKPDLQDSVRTGNSASESPKNRTSESTAFRTLESTKTRTRTGNNKEDKERNKEDLCALPGARSAIAAVASAQAQTPYPEDFDQSLFEEAMLATQDSEQAPEALPDPDADLPPKKQRRSQQPRVPFPETLPDDWAEAAKIARPDIDPQRVFLKLRARYAPTTTKKTLATWKREFMNWIGKEFAYDNRYRSSAQKPQRTLGATDTRSLNHRNFGKWASNAV